MHAAQLSYSRYMYVVCARDPSYATVTDSAPLDIRILHSMSGNLQHNSSCLAMNSFLRPSATAHCSELPSYMYPDMLAGQEIRNLGREDLKKSTIDTDKQGSPQNV